LTQVAIKQIEEAVKLADVPISLTGSGSMFRVHLRETPPQTFREAYQPKEVSALINEMLDFMYHNEQIMMINTFACMFSTVMTQKEVDKLSEGMLNVFRHIKPKLDGCD
jgi:glutamate-1-semialdehyde 2,1-aminomutase